MSELGRVERSHGQTGYSADSENININKASSPKWSTQGDCSAGRDGRTAAVASDVDASGSSGQPKHGEPARPLGHSATRRPSQSVQRWPEMKCNSRAERKLVSKWQTATWMVIDRRARATRPYFAAARGFEQTRDSRSASKCAACDETPRCELASRVAIGCRPAEADTSSLLDLGRRARARALLGRASGWLVGSMISRPERERADCRLQTANDSISQSVWPSNANGRSSVALLAALFAPTLVNMHVYAVAAALVSRLGLGELAESNFTGADSLCCWDP